MSARGRLRARLAGGYRSGPADAGFALVEMIVVIGLVAVLAAVFVPSYIGLQNGSRDMATQSDLASNRSAIVSWSVDNNGLVPDQAAFDPGVQGSDLGPYGWSRADQTRALRSGDYSTDVASEPTRFCLQMTSTTGRTFRVSSNHDVAPGLCADLLRADY